MNRRGTFVFLISLTFLLATSLMADETTRRAEAQPTEAPSASPSVEQGGLTVAIDPVTGQLRAPNAEEARILTAGLRKMLNDSTEGLTAVRLANGAEMLLLEDRFLNVFVAMTQAEGDLQTECLTNADQAAAVVAAAVKAPESAAGKKE